ncbi:MAG: hypothetical protein E7665_01230 [Ruminococcaceae bacterium]|nr:hypothetical protein [Oscillospiraceae bacterium]
MKANNDILKIKKTDIHACFFASDDLKYPDGSSPMLFEDYKVLCEENNIGVSLLTAEMRTEGGHLCQANEDIILLAREKGFPVRFLSSVDPRFALNRASTDLSHFINYYKELGSEGVGCIYSNISVDSNMSMNLYDHAKKCGLSVFLEIGFDTGKGLIDDISLSGLENAVKAFPEVNFVICFADTVSGEKLGKAVENVYALFDKYGNIFMQLPEASNDNNCAVKPELVKKYSNKLLFGTGKVIREKEFFTGRYLDGLYASESLTEEEYCNICCKNAEKVFASGR